MDEASPDTEPRVQPTCITCRYSVPEGRSGLVSCRLYPPDVRNGFPRPKSAHWCGQHRTPDGDFLDRMLTKMEQGVDLETVEELKANLTTAFPLLHGHWAKVEATLAELPAGDHGYLLLGFPTVEKAEVVKGLLRELNDETPSDPKAEGG